MREMKSAPPAINPARARGASSRRRELWLDMRRGHERRVKGVEFIRSQNCSKVKSEQ